MYRTCETESTGECTSNIEQYHIFDVVMSYRSPDKDKETQQTRQTARDSGVYHNNLVQFTSDSDSPGKEELETSKRALLHVGFSETLMTSIRNYHTQAVALKLGHIY
jgi:hypothetical protein